MPLNGSSKNGLEQLSYPSKIFWECTRCGKCCGDVPNHERKILLLPSEAYQISQVKNCMVQDFAESTVDSEVYALKMKKKKGRCIFLNNNTCEIYDIRPLVCHFYPVSLKKENLNYTFNIADECPNIGKGKLLDRSFYLSLLKLAQTRLRVY